MKRKIDAQRATHVRAYATNPDGVIIEVTTAGPTGVQTTLPRFRLSREQWAAMIGIVQTALAIPPEEPR